jgi:hypothetical protein
MLVQPICLCTDENLDFSLGAENTLMKVTWICLQFAVRAISKATEAEEPLEVALPTLR